MDATVNTSVEDRPAEVLVVSGKTFTAVDHGYATPDEHYFTKASNFPAPADYLVRLVRRSTDSAIVDKLSPAGARELANQLLSAASDVEERMRADIDAAREEGAE